jgi:3',5'-cyclic-AMP phosphodiesterase
MSRVSTLVWTLVLLSAPGLVTAGAAATESSQLRFAVLGDAEPKPEARFPHTEAAVAHINALGERQRIDFVIGVGDIAHKGTVLQYENATPVLQRLVPPFYPIMGNEEHNSSVERFLTYAARWNEGKGEIRSARYVVERPALALVMASPDDGRDFRDEGIAWLKAEVQRLAPKPVMLVVHGAQVGIYPERTDKGITHPGFADVVALPNVAAVISGDLHMDMDRVVHSKRIDGVHYLHIPALERTKIPDEDRHTPMLRVFTVSAEGEVVVDTYVVGEPAPLARHAYRFALSERTAARSE